MLISLSDTVNGLSYLIGDMRIELTKCMKRDNGGTALRVYKADV
nr:MAG TPA: hypothetical protein [Bacteriophage sp.]